jgi:chromosome partitioning protein
MGLESIRYAPKRFAQILGVTARELSDAEASGPLLALRAQEPGETKLTYAPADLPRYREVLGKRPPPLPRTRQLFLNFKGGTGKTSVSTSYAFRLAERGYRVLVIDLDSQGHATKCLGLDGDSYPKTLADALIKRTPIREVRVPTGYPGLDVIPSNLGMSTVDLALMPLAGREFRLRNTLKDIEPEYDIIVMDAPPSFGLLNLNALIAANVLVVPLLADFLSFHGLKLLFETVQSLDEDLQHTLDHIFIVINGFNATFKIAKEAKEALEKHYSEFLLKSYIRQDSRFAQASSEGTPVFAYDAESKGAIDVEAVLDEICARLTAEAAPPVTPAPAVPVAATG